MIKRIGTTIYSELIDAVSEMAAKENRSISNMISVLLAEALDKRGVHVEVTAPHRAPKIEREGKPWNGIGTT